MLILTRAETESLLEPDALREAVAAAMADVSAGRASMPARTAAVVDERGGMLAAMLAYLPAVGGLGAKLISLFPGNANGPVPTHQGVVLVFDDHTGTPVALLDGTSITAARTAAGSALSIELLARPESATLAILGTGRPGAVPCRWRRCGSDPSPRSAWPAATRAGPRRWSPTWRR